MRYKEYTVPAATPPMTFDGIWDYVCKGRHLGMRKVGTVVELHIYAFSVEVRLYGTTIAIMFNNGQVYFPSYIDDYWDKQTTKAWLERIALDNGLAREHSVVSSYRKTLYIGGLRLAGKHQSKVEVAS